MTDLYPMLIEPRLDERLWGGRKLATLLGKAASTDGRIGESWEVYEENKILNGSYKGRTIGELRGEMGGDLMGHVPAQHLFPLLTKFIDAQDVLSVQVHPDDRYAREHLGQPYGKTECWYIIEADPEAALIYGFDTDIAPEDYKRLVEEGRLENVLRSLPVKAGDVVFLPARVVHAIGGGILLFELQQTSDVTYRIYDWNRVDGDGHARQLHVAEAMEVLDFHQVSRGVVRPLASEDGSRTTLVCSEYFILEALATDSLLEMSTYDSPVAICSLDRAVDVRAGQGAQATSLGPYQSLLVPAAAMTYSISPRDAGTRGDVLVAYVPRSADETQRDLIGRGFSDAEVDAFVQQFAPAE